MSVSGLQGGTSAAASAPAPASSGTSSTIPSASNIGLRAMQSDNTPLVAGRQVGGVTVLLAEAARKLAPERIKDYAIDFIQLTKSDDPNLYAASVIVAVTIAGNPQAGVGYHTMLLADTAPPPAPRHVTIGDKNVEEVLTIGDAYDEIYVRAALRAVGNRYSSTPQGRLYSADAEVVPAGFAYDDPNAVAVLIANAVYAATTVLNTSLPDFRDLTLEHTNATILETRLSFNQPQSADSTGQPLRTDVKLVTSEIANRQQAKQNERASLNNGQNQTVLATIGGFIDLIYAPVAAAVEQNPFAPVNNGAQQQSLTTYQPTFIITQLHTESLATLPGLLMALAMTEGLREGNNWVGAFTNNHSGGFNNHDIGAIGLEVPVSVDPATGAKLRINTNADSFRARELAWLVDATMRKDLLIQMDIPEVGSQTWLQSVFLFAAEGNPAAIQAIIGAADLLTNRAFSRHYAALNTTGAGPVISARNRIPLGTYRAQPSGEVKDIRELDYLAVINNAEQSPEIWHQWSDTFTLTEQNMLVRADARQRVINEVIGLNAFKQTGHAQRVTLNPALITALARSIAEAQLPIRLVTPYSDPSGQARGTGTWLTQYGLTSADTSLFTRGVSTSPTSGFGGGIGGRWG